MLPIVERELRVASRRAGMYWSRLGAALLATLLAAIIILTIGDHEPSSQVGSHVFQIVVWLVFIYSIGFGMGLTADCISSEKRDGTLGLLFLTDLKGDDVVLGKLAAVSLHAFYGVLAVMPVLALLVMMGGITAGDVIRAVLALFNALFFSAAAGMFASAVCRSKAANWRAIAR